MVREYYQTESNIDSLRSQNADVQKGKFCFDRT